MAETSDWPTIGSLVNAAHAALPNQIYDYIAGGADGEITLARNRTAFESFRLKPRVLRDVSNINLSTRFLGKPLALPFFPTAIGSLDLAHTDGAAGSARAAGQAGAMTCVSMLAAPGFEPLGAAGTGPKMLQIYVVDDLDWLVDMAERAMASGYFALAITVDTAVYGRRERDLINGFSSRKAVDRPGRSGTDLAQRDRVRAAFDWQKLERFLMRSPLPVVLKGVMWPDDARRAVDMGVAAIYVSNHGGRQLDAAPAAIEMLPHIVSAVEGKADIAFDGGIARATDIVIALALGANVVGLGKLQALALAAGGEAGVSRLIALLTAQLETTMALIGVTRPGEVTRDVLV